MRLRTFRPAIGFGTGLCMLALCLFPWTAIAQGDAAPALTTFSPVQAGPRPAGQRMVSNR